MGVAWQNVAYNQPPHVGYYLPDYVEYLDNQPLETPQPEIAIVDMKNIDLTGIYPSSSNTTYFLPVVDVTYDDSSVTPDVTAVFTDSEGNETVVESSAATSYYVQDYEQATDASLWASANAQNNLSLKNDGDSYGKYIAFDSFTIDDNSRSASTLFGSLNIDADIYCIEFDASMKPGATGNTRSQTSELAVISGSQIKDNWNYFSNFKGADCLFDVSQIEYSSLVYKVNGTSTDVTIPSGTWCHYAITVNKNTRATSWVITNNVTNSVIGSGDYELPEGTNMTPTRIYVLAGRYYPEMKIDNISIHSIAVPPFPYAFTEYGTLKVTASVEGSVDNTATFSAPLPYLLDPDNGDPEKFDTYIPVFVNDEKCERPLALADKANAHLWRSGITSNATWATMTLPFNMTKDQVKQAFGDDAVVANLVTSGGNNHSVLFETETGGVTANVPFMIKGVTKETPFLVRDVECAPVVNPVVSTSYFDFVGNYTYAGEAIPFTTSDYFFLSDALHTVAQNGVKMTFYGYRAYFHSIYGHVGNVLQVGFDTETAVCNIDTNTPDLGKVFSITGQRMKVDASGIHSLPKGIYIVNGKKVTVK